MMSHQDTSILCEAAQRFLNKKSLFWLLVLCLWFLSGQVPRAQAQMRTQNLWQVGTLMGQTGRKSDTQVPLHIKSLKVRTKIDGPLVTTEVTHVFKNHMPQTIEGTFRFRLPPQSVLTRLAMDVNGKMMEGEIVEKKKAKRIYEDIVDKMMDPALLEMKRERLFQTRIFPIPGEGQKTVIIQYHHLLHTRNGQATYRYQLPKVSDLARTSGVMNHHATFSTKIDLLDMKIAIRHTKEVVVAPYHMHKVSVGSGLLLSLRQQPFRPQGQLLLAFPRRHGADVRVWRQPTKAKLGSFSAGSVRLPVPQTATQVTPEATDWIILVDTSANTPRQEYNMGIQAALTVMNQMTPQDAFHLMCGDVSTRSFRKGWSTKDRRFDAISFLDRQKLAGGANIQGMLRDALTHVRPTKRTKIIYIGDGQASMGLLVPEQLALWFKKQRKKHPKLSLFAVGVGSAQGEITLKELTASGHGSHVRLFLPQTLHATLGTFKHQIRGALLTKLSLKAVQPGIALLPKTHPPLVAGDRLTFFADTTKAFDLLVTGQHEGHKVTHRFHINPSQGTQHQSLHAYYGHRFLHGPSAQKLSRAKQVKWSKRYGVISRVTSLLVLENEKMYKDNKIKRHKHREQKQRRLAMAKGKSFADWLRNRGARSATLQNSHGIVSKTPQTSWGGGGGGWGGGVGVSPSRVQPGDPVIHIKAPAQSKSVYVVLPHGEIKVAQWNRQTRTWVVRFLVPNDLPDGVYHIQVFVIHADGQVEKRKTYYTIDTHAPTLRFRASRLTNGRWKLVGTQVMSRQEVLRSLGRRQFKKTGRVPDTAYDVQRVYALDPHKRLFRFTRTGASTWQAIRRLPKGVRLEISVIDSAGNIKIQQMTIPAR